MQTTDTGQLPRRFRQASGVLLALAALTSGGCAWQEPARVEADFGKSVRQMVQAQIHDTQAASRPATNGPDLIDGSTAAIGVEGVRQATREARKLRTQNPDNPVPVTGLADSVEDE